MGSFFWRIVRYLLWFCLLLLLGLFFFWLIKFNGNFVEYINYLNNIDLEQIIPAKTDEKALLQDKKIKQEVVENQDLNQDTSGLLDDDYFLPESVSSEDEEVLIWFSWALENKSLDTWLQDQSPSVSKDDLVNLIKSREK